MSWILRLEDHRVLRSTVPVAATASRGGAVLSPVVPDLVLMLGDGEARVRRRAALAVGRVGLAEGVPPLVRLDGQPMTFSVALVRSLSSFFSAFALFLGFFWAGWDKQRQAWHDKIAGTVVVAMPKGISLI